MSNSLIVIAHNIRSSHNVGSLLRTCEGLGVQKVYLTGYTPYPLMENDARLPHHAQKTAKQINKTALGAESSIDWSRLADLDQLNELIIELKQNNYVVAGLEQNTNSIFINEFAPPQKLAIILGSEVDGIQPELIAKCDVLIEIPMKGKKESFNVVEAASMALFYCLYG